MRPKIRSPSLLQHLLGDLQKNGVDLADELHRASPFGFLQKGVDRTVLWRLQAFGNLFSKADPLADQEIFPAVVHVDSDQGVVIQDFFHSKHSFLHAEAFCIEVRAAKPCMRSFFRTCGMGCMRRPGAGKIPPPSAVRRSVRNPLSAGFPPQTARRLRVFDPLSEGGSADCPPAPCREPERQERARSPSGNPDPGA